MQNTDGLYKSLSGLIIDFVIPKKKKKELKKWCPDKTWHAYILTYVTNILLYIVHDKRRE